MYKSEFKFLVMIFFIASITSPLMGYAQENEVEFDNKSGKQALVKLIGSTMREVDVPINSKRSVTALPGTYYIMVRYGTPENYQYSKGEKFEVTETATMRSRTTITLHKVIDGNYDAKPISEGEFAASLTNTENIKEVDVDNKPEIGADKKYINEKVSSNWQNIIEEDKIFTEDHLRMYLISCFVFEEDKDNPIFANNAYSIGIKIEFLMQHYGPPERVAENIDIADVLHPRLTGKAYFYGEIGILTEQTTGDILGLFVPKKMKTSYIMAIKRITDEKNIKLR